MSLSSNSDCTSKQTFCALSYEVISTLIDVDAKVPNFQVGQLIPPKLYNSVKEILQDIHDYGSYGTRNPSTTELNTLSSVDKNAIIYYNNYNNILKILNKNDLLISGGTTIITKDLIDNLKTYIKAYKFNTSRCNFCNEGNDCSQCTSCNISCDHSPDLGCGCYCISDNTGPCTGEGCSCMWDGG